MLELAVQRLVCSPASVVPEVKVQAACGSAAAGDSVIHNGAFQGHCSCFLRGYYQYMLRMAT